MARWSIAIAAAIVALTMPSWANAASTAVGVEDLTDDFDRFAGKTADLSDAERAKRFRGYFAARAGGFYDLRDQEQARYDARTVEALKAWPKERAAVLGVALRFNAAFARGVTKFRRAFPDFKATMPIYVVHSLGEMDGGTRDYGDGTMLIFGADVIARIHNQQTIEPLFDHELFHVYHTRYFPECQEVWCGLWVEGLAVYMTARLNPGADDAALLLTSPQPIRQAIEPHLREAMCALKGKLDSKRPEDIASLFQGQPVQGSPFPPRYGYFLGYVLAQQLGHDRSLARLARMKPAEVRPLLEKVIAAYGLCRTPIGRPV